MPPTGYNKKQAAKETDVSEGEVQRCWHQAKNDYQDSYGDLGSRDRSEKNDSSTDGRNRKESK